MTVIVTDRGFGPEDFDAPLHRLGTLQSKDCRGQGVTLGPDTPPAALAGTILEAAMIRIEFPSFADGRGFTLARLLRAAGYAGRLRAAGHLVADQYAMARRAGFDEVEITAEMAARQPEAQWRARAGWQAHDYRRRLSQAGHAVTGL